MAKVNKPITNDTFVSIQMMDQLRIKVNGYNIKPTLFNSRKSVALLQYLILANGQPVLNQRLILALWSDEHNVNPENALKTMISRMRTMLNQISEGLGKCIVASHGAYQWINQPNVSVDVLTICFLMDRISRHKQNPELCKPLYKQLMNLYEGDFMQSEGLEQDEWIASRAASIHMRYTSAVYDYLDLLRREEDYEEIYTVCRRALEINSFDDRLHTELIDALAKTGRHNDAMNQYKTAEQQKYHYLGTPLSAELQAFYRTRIIAAQSMDASIEAIASELTQNEATQGAYICEYPVFRDVYNLQVRNVERMGATMNLAVIQIGDNSNRQLTMLDQDNLVQGLMDVLRHNLRKGDLITRYNATTVALMLPMQDPEMGHLALERIRHEFFRKYPNSAISFMYRLQRISNPPIQRRQIPTEDK